MADRDQQAWRIKSKMEPDFEGGLIHNDFIQATVFIRVTKAQRNAIGSLFRGKSTDHTTLCFVTNDKVFYELINNPTTESTQDSDWESISQVSAGGNIIPIGDWDISNTDPVLTDAGAIDINGNFYYAVGAPNPVDVTIPGLFLGQTKQIINGDYIMSMGTHWEVIQNATTWESLNRPQVIIDYENGTVIAHLHEISDVNGLVTALSSKYDASDLADMVLDYINVPDSGIVNVAFLRKHFYDKTVLYTKDDIDSIVSQIEVSDTDFNWNRNIRKLPQVGDVPGTSKLGSGIDEIYYGFIKPENNLVVTNVYEVGSTVSPQATGFIDPKDVASFTGLAYIKDKDDNAGASFTPSTPPTISNFDEALNSIVILAAQAQWYYLEYNYKKLLGDPDTNVIGSNIYINGVYPFLTGMTATGLIGSTIYSALTKLISERSTQVFTINGTDNRVYIAYPVAYGQLGSIVDESGNELIGSLFPSSPATMAVDSAGLTADWQVDYYVYESDYNISATQQKYVVYFDTEEQVVDLTLNLDNIAEGVTNKHFTSTHRDKLDSITINPADIGDMKESEYTPLSTISGATGLVDKAMELAVTGRNDTLSDIPAGRYVKIVEVDFLNLTAVVELADKDSNDNVDAFANEILTASGGTGKIIIIGYNIALDTTGHPLGTLVYLGQNGTVQYTQPTSGSFIQVGEVMYEGNPGLIESLRYINRLSANFQADWRSTTAYPKHTKIAAASPVYPTLGSFLLRTKDDIVSAASFDPTAPGFWDDYEILGGDMKTALYDPTSVLDDAFLMDNMNDTINYVRMSIAERTKLAGLEDPIYKGTFADPSELRAAYPTSNNGDEATVISTATTWSYVTNATNDWVDTLISIGGDMQRSVYDPTNVIDDAFDMDNFVEGSDVAKRFFSDAEKSKLAAFGAASTYYNKTESDALLILKADKTYVDNQDDLKMTITTYDPDTIAGDAFDMDSMKEGTNLILSAAERTQISTNTTDIGTNADVISDLITGVQVIDKIILDDLTGSEPSYVDGQLFSAGGGLNYHGEFSAVTLQIGQEQYIKVHNDTGVAIANGRAVRQTGVLGGIPTVALAQADLLTTSRILGLATMLIPNGQEGLVTTFGSVGDVDTDGFTAGDTLYLSDVDSGLLVSTAPDIATHVGAALDSVAGTGKMFVSIDNHLSLPTIYGALSGGSAGTTFVADTYQSIANYSSSDNVVMSINATTGTITTPTTGKYTFSANLAMAFDAIGNQNETLTIGIHNGTSIIKEIVEFLPKTAEGSSLYPHFMFDGTAGISYHIEVKCSAALTGVTYSLSEFDITSVHIR